MRPDRTRNVAARVALAALVGSALLAQPALAGSGGVSAPGSSTAPVHKATLVNGKAIAPSDAPARVKRAIRYANRIRNKPYVWGGGHGGWAIDNGYDCSGAVSYALHGAKMLSSPEASPALMHWGIAGRGRWITVFSNTGHAYAVIAGLRWDTSGDAHGTGPRWHKDMRSGAGYAIRRFNKRF